MKGFMLGLGNWGAVIFIAFVYGIMIATLGWRGRKKPYRYSLKQGALFSTAGMIPVLIATALSFWGGIALLVGLGILFIQYGDAVSRYIDK